MRRRICFSDPRTIRTIECRAAVSWEPNSKFVIENIEVAPPKKNEVRIKMTHSSICRSDLFGLAKLSPFTLFPIVLGHEGSGIVESVGEGVENLQPGDHVIPVFVPQCNECRACKCKKTNLCDAYSNPKFKGVQIFSSVMRDGTSRFTCKGKPIYHYLGLSTFSEYTVVADIQVAKINPEAPLEKVCLLGCGVATGYGAALNTAKVEEGSTCAVWGLGAIGLAVIMGCKKAGASRIIGIDVSPDKFVVAKKFGMTESLNPNDYDKPIQQVLMDITDGGLDYAFECIGNVDVMRAALESCHKGWGVAVLLGIVGGDKEVSTKPFQIVTGRTLKGSIYGDWKRDDIPKLVEAYMNKDIQIDEFITHNKTIEEINEAFDLLRAAKCIRTVMTF